MARGFLYLAGVMDWFARRILAWRLSITLGADFCIDAVEEALRLYGRPEIFNSDQGSQFTSDAFTDILITKGIAISMDGKGSWRDNVFVERFWRTLKYEEVYLKAYESVAEARSSIGCYLEFYNGRRPHFALDRRTPDQAYYASLPLTPVGVPLNDAGILFKEPEPPLGMAGGEVMGSESRWLRVTVACGSGCT